MIVRECVPSASRCADSLTREQAERVRPCVPPLWGRTHSGSSRDSSASASASPWRSRTRTANDPRGDSRSVRVRAVCPSCVKNFCDFRPQSGGL